MYEMSDSDLTLLAQEAGIDVEEEMRHAPDPIRDHPSVEPEPEEEIVGSPIEMESETDLEAEAGADQDQPDSDQKMSYESRAGLSRKILQTRMLQAQPRLEQLHTEAEELYVAVTRGIQEYFNSILPKALGRSEDVPKSQTTVSGPD